MIKASDIGKYIKVVATGIGLYTGSVTSAASSVVSDSSWIAGLTGTGLEGKYVKNANLAGTYVWYSLGTPYAIQPPQGVASELVNPQINPSVDFSNFPAQNACKNIGGRLPTLGEFYAINASKATYGNNFSSTPYWTNLEPAGAWGADRAYAFGTDVGYEYGINKGASAYVRCVAG